MNVSRPPVVQIHPVRTDFLSPEQCDRTLTAAERARRDRYTVPDRAHQFAVTRATLRLLLGERLGLRPDRVPLDCACPHCGLGHGPPRLVGHGQSWSLSIAHSGRLALIALAPRALALGVDVELPENGYAAARVLGGSPVGSLRRWVRSEARYKASLLRPADRPASGGGELGPAAVPVVRDLTLPAPWDQAVAALATSPCAGHTVHPVAVPSGDGPGPA